MNVSERPVIRSGKAAVAVGDAIQEPLAHAVMSLDFIALQLEHRRRGPVAFDEVERALADAREAVRRALSIASDLRVAANPDGGFELVVDAAAAEARASLSEAVARGEPAPLRVLVVDEEASIRRAFERMLEGHVVRCVAGATEALALCAEQSFDVVFCALMLPERGGEAVYHALAAQTPSRASTITFITGGGSDAAMLKFVQAAGNAVLFKPFERGALLAALGDTARDPIRGE